jgi:ribosomal-protein-serine acetyltransferase
MTCFILAHRDITKPSGIKFHKAEKNKKKLAHFRKNKSMILKNEKISASLSLHLLEENMAGEMFSLIDSNREHLGRWLPWVKNTNAIGDSLAFIRDSRLRFAKNEALVFWIREGEEAVGTVGFHFLNSDTVHTQIGYWLAKSAEGRGLVRQAVLLMMAYFFEQHRRDCLEIHCDIGNKRSQNVALGLGFSHQKTLFGEPCGGNQVVDFEVYMLTRTEWERLYG